MDEILLSIAILIITILLGYYFKNRIRPIALVQNQMDFIEQFQENMIQRQPLNNLNMTSYTNPFNIILMSSQSSAKEGIRFKIQVNNSESIEENKPIHLLVAWGVQIDGFYSEIERHINEIFYPIGEENSFLKRISILVEHQVLTDLKNQKEFFYKIPTGECQELFSQLDSQQNIRNHFHVVVTLFKDSCDLSSLSPNDIIANVNIYHLKDSKMESKHIQNLIKFKNNRVANINRIFVEEENLCVVCQTNQAVQVLLPCSHKCVCSECIQRLNRKCPLCRSPINNKFEVAQ